MDSLVFYLIWAVVVFLVLRFGRDARAMSVGQGQQVMPKRGLERNPKQLGWIAPKTSIDPVCGNSVQTSYAKSSVDDGAVYYFCSRECRERFEVGPHLYLGQTPDAPAEQVSHG